jgi:sulfoxide reductase heme-binding subunit YedZ
MNVLIAIRRLDESQLLAAKIVTFGLCLLPFVQIIAATFNLAGLSLGANPVEEIIHRLGLWGLRLLLLTLAITPLRQLTGMNWLVRLRRMLGLFSFFYILMHFLSYALIDQHLDLSAIIEDILERPYITLGITALTLMFPLAMTSTNRMMKRLGRKWQQLHRFVYLIATLGVWHFYWQVKKDVLEPLVYAGLLALLLGFRIIHRRRQLRRRMVAEGLRSPGSEQGRVGRQKRTHASA